MEGFVVVSLWTQRKIPPTFEHKNYYKVLTLPRKGLSIHTPFFIPFLNQMMVTHKIPSTSH
jgi:hypothetical protein